MTHTVSTSPVIDLVARATEAHGRPPVYKVIGLVLAISSGLFIGTSFVLKKVGLLKANVKYNEAAGEGYGYLKNAWWWSGMTLMIIGEICNFAAYAFTDAILVTPMGALSVVVTTILSAIFLKERLSFVGKVGCFNCIVGSVVIVLNAPTQSSVSNIQEMKDYVITPGFLSYSGVIVFGCVFIALWAGPRYGKKSMLVYLSICSLIGGLSVVATQGLGAAIIAQIGGQSQFKYWFLYVLLAFVVATLLTEIIYLNKALNLFNAAMVTPTYYVYFTSSTMVTSCVLFRGLGKNSTALEIVTILMGFLQICTGVILLQLSKSAKDVPDAAVFNGDLDQIRTVAEQEEFESEPKADAIRGTAALVRSFSVSRQRKEAEEAKRIHDERLEPIGENEQVEWDGLRRRKTVISISDAPTQQQRRKTIHPPLGMSHFPEDTDDDAQTHNPEDDFGVVNIFSDIRKRTMSVLNPRRNSSIISAHRPSRSHTMPLTEMHGTASHVPYDTSTHDFSPDSSNVSGGAQEKPQPLTYVNAAVPGDLHHDETAHKAGSAMPISIRWVPDMTVSPHTTSPRQSRSASPSNLTDLEQGPLDPPPAIHGHEAASQRARRQFSFQNVFSRRPGEEQQSSSGSSSLRGLGRRGKNVPAQTEEERLGLVSGDGRAATAAKSAIGTENERLSGQTRDEHYHTTKIMGGEYQAVDAGIKVPISRTDAGNFNSSYKYENAYDDYDYDDDFEDVEYARTKRRNDYEDGSSSTAFV